MRTIAAISIVIALFACSCGSGDTGEGYSDTAGSIKANAQLLDSNVAPAAGERGNPDSSMRNSGMTTSPVDSGLDNRSRRK